MNMKRNIIYLCIIFCSCFLSACSEFLEEKAQNEVRVQSVQDYSEYLLYYTDRGNMGLSLENIMEILSDDIEITNYSQFAKVETYSDYFTWQPTCCMKNLDNTYEKLYESIMGTNCVLDGIDNATGGTLEQKERVKAKALALRAENYFILVNLYGEPYKYNKKALGVPLKLNASLLENGIARNTVEEVYNQMVKDLTQAIELFKKYEKKRDDGMNITSSYILLSRIYLYMEEWEKAAQMATNAINTSLGLTDYTTISSFKPAYTFSEVEYVNHVSYTTLLTGSVFYVSRDFIATLDNNDQRRFWFNLSLQAYYIGLKKWSTSGEYRMYQAMRISEAYLNRMEANIMKEQPNVQEALADLNLLRRNRIKNYEDVSISDSQELLEEIRAERRKELCFDGHRWFDLRRYGMPAITRAYKLDKKAEFQYYTLQEKDPLYTLPIPDKAFENNPQLEQNSCAYGPVREPDVEESVEE